MRPFLFVRSAAGLGVNPATKAHETLAVVAAWIAMRPVHHATHRVPFVHAAKRDSIANADRNALCKVEIVCNQHGLAARQGHDETLVGYVIFVFKQQAGYDPGILDPVVPR